MSQVLATGREGAKRVALARMGFGVLGLAAPTVLGRIWIGSEGASSRVAIITRAFAVRDLALGLGAFMALRKDAPVRGWVEAGLLSDVGDTIATLASDAHPVHKGVLLSATLTGVAGGVISLSGLS